jgi:PAS domain S-box-containing protein/putative nucleotidyltransferase with HDIG domain
LTGKDESPEKNIDPSESQGQASSHLVDNSKLGIYRCTPGPGGKFIDVNKTMEDITGYSRDELLGMNASKIWTNTGEGDANSEADPNVWKVTCERQLTRKDGQHIPVADTVVMVRYDSGTVQSFDGIIEDITSRKQEQLQVQQRLQKQQKTFKQMIEAMAYIVEVRDPYTAGHQRQVARLSLNIAKYIGLREEQLEGLYMAAIVHDIGKLMVPADILNKSGALTKPEFGMLKDHARIGYEIFHNIELPWPVAQIILQHHERMNGSGYPSGLKGDEIILEARILAVAEVVEAISSHAPYRPALGIGKALEEINLNSGTLYDSAVVDACNRLFAGFNFD